MLVRVKGEREGGRRGEVHGVEHFGELGHDSGERFLGKGSLSWLTEASTRCARRRGSGQDGDGLGELEQPERPTPSSCWCGRWRRRVSEVEEGGGAQRGRAGVGAIGGARGRPAVPRGVLADAWRPRGVRALTRPGACAVDGRGAREQGRGAEACRAALCGWAKSEAAAH